MKALDLHPLPKAGAILKEQTRYSINLDFLHSL